MRDEDGDLIWGRGAWEIAARYSYVDLNSGSGADRIQGGIMDGVTVGLNWYLNTNLTVNFDWVYDNRYDSAHRHHPRGLYERLRSPRAVVILTSGPQYPYFATGENKHDREYPSYGSTRTSPCCRSVLSA